MTQAKREVQHWLPALLAAAGEGEVLVKSLVGAATEAVSLQLPLLLLLWLRH